MGERGVRNAEVEGSNPLPSTTTYNIVLIVADAYRRDSLSIFNPDYPFTPRLERAMGSWYRFPYCFSSAPWTLPSCSTILTGVHASTHGYYFHDRPLGRPTLADHLGARFQRLGVVNNGNLTDFSGVPAGFDKYHYFKGHDEPYEKARELLAHTDPETPYFLLFHTNLAHDYFLEESRRYFEACFPDRGGWFPMSRSVISWAGLTADERARIRSFYDACVARMDEKLSDLLGTLDLERTVVCFVADHGEGLDYEQGRVHHGGRLHNDLIHVPLLIHVPPGAPAALHAALRSQQGSCVSTSDIAPTLLELAGVAVPVGLDGQSLVQPGPASASRALPGEDRRYLYSGKGERVNVNRSGKNTTWRMRFRNRLVRSTVARAFNLKAYLQYPYKLITTTYVHSPRLPRLVVDALCRHWVLFSPDAVALHHDDVVMAFELFDLESDPGEQVNVLTDRSVTGLRRQLAAAMPGVDDFSILVGERACRLGDVLGAAVPARA